MPRNSNYLLGEGERLTSNVSVKRRGGDKNSPYTFDEAKKRVESRLAIAQDIFNKMPEIACPNNDVVAVITMHPRYTAKSEFPQELLNQLELTAIGSRSRRVKPEKWGIKNTPEDGIALTEEIFVRGHRDSFEKWLNSDYEWGASALNQITHIEDVTAFQGKDKLKGIPRNEKVSTFEIVLHGGNEDRGVLDLFGNYARVLDCYPFFEKMHILDFATFLPVIAPVDEIERLADFSLVRIARGMPKLRPNRPDIMRLASKYFQVQLPNVDPVDPSIKAVIFDGGLPDNHGLDRWVNYIEPVGIGSPEASAIEHGMAVTSAFLFGPIEDGKQLPAPMCKVDHVRVLDDSHSSFDTEYFDVLGRITEHMRNREADDQYEYISLSIGPDFAIDDDDISAWTAEIDSLGVGGKNLITTAAGNNGLSDHKARLNRVQPPADGVNILSVGSANGQDMMWNRANYSAIGPGRCPGVVKPDGLAFGGCSAEPFYVLSASMAGFAEPQCGTSFAGPYTNRSGISIRAQLGSKISPQMVRALMIHQADRDGKNPVEVGWGRFQTSEDVLITCEDWEAVVMYEGEMPVGGHLRMPIPWINNIKNGYVTITATMVISPEIDVVNPNAYTRGGLEVVFRPDKDKKNKRKDGSYSVHPASSSFFNPKNIWGTDAVYIDAETSKWECAQKASQRFNAESLNDPFFDVYCHQRQGATRAKTPVPIPYSMVVTVSVLKTRDFYNRVLRQYAGVLRPVLPVNRIQLRG